MTVLSREILIKHGPYISFVDLPTPYKVYADEWPNMVEHKDDVFFDFSDDLVSLYCNVTRTFWIFDHHDSVQIVKPHEILKLSAQFLGLAQQITRIRHDDMNKELEHCHIYKGSSLEHTGAEFTGEALRLDLVETAIFIAGRLAKMAHANRVLYIDGI